jgi:DNA invertase Pin-like site-specific DNA recombinase
VKEERSALNQLMRDCRAGEIAVIILPSLDRLSREVRIAENLFYEFKKLNIKVLIADMPQYDGDRQDVLIRQIMEAIAEENRKDIIERLYKGRQERVRKGLFPGGNLPYGFVRKDRNVVIEPVEAEIVRVIYKLAYGNFVEAKIAAMLNSSGYKQRNGKPWNQRQVCRILNRERLYRYGGIHYGIAKGINDSFILIK